METNMEEKNKQDVMISNLPLLFSDGKPISLVFMKVEDLQYFLPFLLKCILGCEPSGWVRYPKFKWWPSDVPWSPIILTKKYQTQHWGNKLRALVRNCYEYNGCAYLLHFSAKLQTLSGGYRFEDNWDGTTSMHDSTSGKLLVTFQNENMNYDKGFRQQSSASRPMLLPRLNSPTSPAKLGPGASNSKLAIQAPPAAKMVEPPVNDIYLCDYCGADFCSLSAIKAHETKCMADKALEAHSSNNYIEMETQEIDQAKFMWYLSLSSRNQTLPPSNVTPAKVRPAIKRACTLSDKRFTTIPFSSNLGQSWKATRLTAATSETLVSRYERLCVAKPIQVWSAPFTGELTGQANPLAITNRFRPVVFKRKEEWSHSYSFSRADRRERMKTIATGLSKRSRLLLRQCRDALVPVIRLKPEVIEMWIRPKPKRPQPLLQPWLQRSIANLPSSCTISLAPVDSTQTCLRQQHAHTASPSLTTSRPGLGKPFMAAKPNVPGNPQARSPPGLPFITSAWSMQTMQSVKINPSKSQSTLPDLIPINNKNSKTQPYPVILKMPSFQSPPRSITLIPKSVTSSSKVQMFSKVNTSDIVDLCSSEDESDDEKRPTSSRVLSKSLVIPPGISITKVNRTPTAVHCDHQNSRPKVTSPENNNNRARRVSQWLNSTGGNLPELKFMGQHELTIKKDVTRSIIVPDALLADSSSPIVQPLKIGKLPVEKREQMKQSLLKIQQQEGMTTVTAEENSPLEANAVQPSGSDEFDPLLLPSSLEIVSSPKKHLSQLLSDNCKEVKQTGLSDLLFPIQQQTQRKRSKEPDFYSCDEDDYLSDGPSKKIIKLDRPPSSTSRNAKESYGDRDSYSTVIEVDLEGPDTENRDSSRASSFGSLTPDNRNPRKRNELIRLLNDECKELRRKGLEDLSIEPDSNQRITRCRTKSLPLVTNKR